MRQLDDTHPYDISPDEKINAHLLIEQLEPGLREGAVPDNASIAIKTIKMRPGEGFEQMLREQTTAIQSLVTEQRKQRTAIQSVASKFKDLRRSVRTLGESSHYQMVRTDFPALSLSSSRGSSAAKVMEAYNPTALQNCGAALCNVSGRVWDRRDIKGAHLYQLRWFSQCDVLEMCGVQGINHPSNMLLMHASIEGRYDKMQFTLLPDAAPNTYKIKVLDPTLMTGQANMIQTCPGPVYSSSLTYQEIQQWHESREAPQKSSLQRDVQAATASPAAAQAPGQQVSEAGVQEGQEGRAADRKPSLRWSDLDEKGLVFATDARPSGKLMHFLANRAVLEAEAKKWIQKGSVVVPNPTWLAIKDTDCVIDYLKCQVMLASTSSGTNNGSGGGSGDSTGISNTDVGSVDCENDCEL